MEHDRSRLRDYGQFHKYTRDTQSDTSRDTRLHLEHRVGHRSLIKDGKKLVCREIGSLRQRDALSLPPPPPPQTPTKSDNTHE